MKIKILVLNLSTESVNPQNQQFITCYSLLHFILLKMTISICDEKLTPQQLLYYNQSCSILLNLQSSYQFTRALGLIAND